jgi:hypothetical protein
MQLCFVRAEIESIRRLSNCRTKPLFLRMFVGIEFFAYK